MASQEVLTALETLHREIEKLEPAIKHVEAALQVTQIVKGIPEKHLELLQAVKNNDELHKKELYDTFSKELHLLTEEFRKLGKNTEEIQNQAKYEQKYLAELREKAVVLYQGIESVHFPERLDKLDANVSGIMAAVQSVQSRLDGLERNITDRLRDQQDYQKETRLGVQTTIEQLKASLQSSLEQAAKKQQAFTYITWLLIILSIIIFFVVKK